jgi:hypothetical protein
MARTRTRTPDRLSVHPAIGVQAAQEYIQVAGFALMAIKQVAELVAVLPATPEKKLETLLERITEELAKVQAILPEDSEI